MKEVKFKSEESFAKAIKEAYKKSQDDDEWEDHDISVIGYYIEIEALFVALVCEGYSVRNVVLEDPESRGYEDEWILSILDGEIWIEPMKRNDGYLYDQSYITFIYDDCNSAVLKYIEPKYLYEVSVGSPLFEAKKKHEFNADSEDSSEDSEDSEKNKDSKENEKSHADTEIHIQGSSSYKKTEKDESVKKESSDSIVKTLVNTPNYKFEQYLDKDDNIHGFNIQRKTRYSNSSVSLYSTDALPDDTYGSFMDLFYSI